MSFHPSTSLSVLLHFLYGCIHMWDIFPYGTSFHVPGVSFLHVDNVQAFLQMRPGDVNTKNGKWLKTPSCLHSCFSCVDWLWWHTYTDCVHLKDFKDLITWCFKTCTIRGVVCVPRLSQTTAVHGQTSFVSSISITAVCCLCCSVLLGCYISMTTLLDLGTRGCVILSAWPPCLWVSQCVLSAWPPC